MRISDWSSDVCSSDLSLRSGSRLKSKGRQIIPAGDVLIIDMPGGGGYGHPHLRDPQQVLQDVRNGLVSRVAAQTRYGGQITDDLRIEDKENTRLRASKEPG